MAETEDQQERELTFGEDAMGVNFNPSNDPTVTKLKALYAEIADILNADRGDNRDERARLASVAITEAQGAQMWAVKAVTKKREAK
jgi:hypothetical protein